MLHLLAGSDIDVNAILDVAGLPCKQIKVDVKTVCFLNKIH